MDNKRYQIIIKTGQEPGRGSMTMSETRDLLAQNIRRLRKIKGMQVNQLAEASGLSRSFVGMVEHSKVNISIDKIEAIAKVLGVEVYVLFVTQQK